MHFTEIVKYPILTEKSSQQIDQKIYTFAVDKRATKDEVKRVIEFIFDHVKVAKVNIMTIRKKPKKLGKFAGFKSGYKKAIVTLKTGSIPLFKDEKPVDEKHQDKLIIDEKVIAKKPPISEIEKRAAEKIAAKAQQKQDEKEKVAIEDEKDKAAKTDDHQDEEK